MNSNASIGLLRCSRTPNCWTHGFILIMAIVLSFSREVHAQRRIPIEQFQKSIVEFADDASSHGVGIPENLEMFTVKEKLDVQIAGYKYCYGMQNAEGQFLLNCSNDNGFLLVNVDEGLSTETMTQDKSFTSAYSPEADCYAYFTVLDREKNHIRHRDLRIQRCGEPPDSAAIVLDISGDLRAGNLRFSPDGRYLVTSIRRQWNREEKFYEEELFLFDAKEREKVASKLIYGILPDDYEFTSNNSKLLMLGICPPLERTSTVATGSITVMDLNNLEVIYQRSYPDYLKDLALAEGPGIYAFISYKALYIGEFPSMKVWVECEILPGADRASANTLRTVEISPDASYIALTKGNGTRTVHDVSVLLGSAR